MAEEWRILVVDDSPTDRKAMRNALEAGGAAELTEAGSGEEALRTLRAGRFDAVICDQHLGAIDGISLLEVVRRESPSTCRVLVTGHAEFELAREAINRAGVHAFLQKPVSAATLRGALRSGLERARSEP